MGSSSKISYGPYADTRYIEDVRSSNPAAFKSVEQITPKTNRKINSVRIAKSQNGKKRKLKQKTISSFEKQVKNPMLEFKKSITVNKKTEVIEPNFELSYIELTYIIEAIEEIDFATDVELETWASEALASLNKLTETNRSESKICSIEVDFDCNFSEIKSNNDQFGFFKDKNTDIIVVTPHMQFDDIKVSDYIVENSSDSQNDGMTSFIHKNVHIQAYVEETDPLILKRVLKAFLNRHKRESKGLLRKVIEQDERDRLINKSQESQRTKTKKYWAKVGAGPTISPLAIGNAYYKQRERAKYFSRNSYIITKTPALFKRHSK